MSHLLATVNQAAADEIRPDPPAPDLPDVGHLVIYTMRQGFARQGRNRFNALVQGHGDRGTLNLLVMIDANDFVDEQFVAPAGPGAETHCWEWPDDSRSANGFRGTIAALHQRIGELEENAADIRAVVLGDFEAPKVSIIHIMQDFETRLRVVAGETKSLREAGDRWVQGDGALAPRKPRAAKKAKKSKK